MKNLREVLEKFGGKMLYQHLKDRITQKTTFEKATERMRYETNEALKDIDALLPKEREVTGTDVSYNVQEWFDSGYNRALKDVRERLGKNFGLETKLRY